MRLIVAASGGVAALKTPSLLRRLAEAGHAVRAAATDDALHFVTKLSLAVAAGGEVFDRAAWFTPDGEARHITWARWADALIIATEWSLFREPDFDLLRRLLKAPLIFDGRNIYGLEPMRDHGFIYQSIGRPVVA